jgi:GNAT superfamily N-acetyltransferase
MKFVPKKLVMLPCNKGDVAEVSRLIYGSATARLSYLYSGEKIFPEAYIAESFLCPKGFFSFNHHYKFLVENEIVATIAVYENWQIPIHSLHSLIFAIRKYGFSAAANLLKKRIKVSGALPPLKLNSIYGDNLCVSRAMRGKGIAIQIMEAILELYERRGMRYFYCDVEKNNKSARRLYQRLGLVPVEELIGSPEIQLPDMLRLQKKLR